MATRPYKCPICEGTTQVEKGFYPDDPTRTRCRACLQGVVYGQEADTPIFTAPEPYPLPRPYPVPIYPRPYRPPWRRDNTWRDDDIWWGDNTLPPRIPRVICHGSGMTGLVNS
jgi:hypothetical protein